MFPCQVCKEPRQNLSELACGHLHCSECIHRDPKDETVTCQWSRNERKCNVHSLESEIQPLKSLNGPQVTYDPSNKCMEPELVALYRDMEQQQESRDQNSPDASDSPRENQDDIEELDDLDVIGRYIVRLSEMDLRNTGIKEMYEDANEEKITLFVDIGSSLDAKSFVMRTLGLTETGFNEVFEIEEQDINTEFLLNTGAKIGPASLFLTLLTEGSHPDELRDTNKISTVTCLGEDDQGQLYILTTKHSFGNHGDPPPGDFISSYNSKLTRVSSECQGILDSVKLPNVTGNLFIDIAAMKLTKKIQDNLKECPEMLHPLNNLYSDGKRERKSLKNRVVYKHGAVSGTTCGRIVKPISLIRHKNERNDDMSGLGFLVESNDKHGQQFAGKGDSGSLIWDDQAVPIGIVSLMIDGFVTSKGKRYPPMIFAVRLDYCLKALRDRTRINIVSCKVFGAPIPAYPKGSYKDPSMEISASNADIY